MASRSQAAASAKQGPANQFYLPELDGLRFIAFLLVFFHHFGPDVNFVQSQLARNLLARFATFGWVGVDIFFCLSAFLITSLLLREYKITGAISLKRFYIRRALRIWPLYYLCLILAFVVYPLAGFFSPRFGTAEYHLLIRQHLLAYIVFLGNFSYAYFPNSLTFAISPLWSISVEEQFYLLWPPLLSFLQKVNRRTMWGVLGALLAVSITARIYITAAAIPYPMVWTNTFARMEPIIFGTGVAFLYSRRQQLLPAWIAVPLAIALYGIVSSFPQIGQSIHTVWQLFAVASASAALLIGVLSSRLSRVILGNPVLRWAGKLSFGFYVYHKAALLIAPRIVPLDLSAAPATRLLVIFGLSLAITMAVSAISYYGFERWFLRAKDQFAIVHSRAISTKSEQSLSGRHTNDRSPRTPLIS